MEQDICPNSKSQKHYYQNPPVHKADFVPTTYGDSAEDTLYRRVEYTIALCSCGKSVKRKVEVERE